MAISLKRAFSPRNLIFLRSSIYHSRDLSFTSSSNALNNNNNSVSETPLLVTQNGAVRSLGYNFFGEFRRGFAKGKKSKDDSGSDTVEVVPDIGPSVKSAAISQMEAAIVALSRDLSKLRTGRASPGMLDHIIVETSGVKMPLIRVAAVSVLDSHTLSVTPYDSNAIKKLENAIISSPLGLNPRVDGQRLVASIPPLTKEHIQAMCKLIAKSSEDVKQSIRRARQKAFDTIKKVSSSIPKDNVKKMEKEVDELTKKYVKSAEDMCKAKEKEIGGS
ncbi:hypothetical protein GIB67_009296 [Kingdonia uniflora]|uniref:Ribosome-recycling factor, chloroplastic n=1 Tax=Kingdonia uniflora TaxID=39325 RepID=A0A7J7N2S4_9MAGN|nr:hypothetical protein GIB67_009296 [Kingdonia uniflora]